jgi:hypothetical protein
MNHTIHSASSKTDNSGTGEDEAISGLQAQISTTRTLITNLEELGALEFAYDIRQYKLSVISLCKEVLELQKVKSGFLKQKRASLMQSSSAIVRGVLAGSGLSSLSTSGGHSSFTQATVPLPSPPLSLFTSPVVPPPIELVDLTEIKSMSVPYFDKKMEETYGPVNEYTSMP